MKRTLLLLVALALVLGSALAGAAPCPPARAANPTLIVVAWGMNDNEDYDPSVGGESTCNQAIVPEELNGVAAIAVAGGRNHSLALKADGTVVAWGCLPGASVPDDLPALIDIAAGGYHNLGLKGDGTVVAWGLDDAGQCDVPPGLSGVVAVAAGRRHSLALKSGGTVVAWGLNNAGQCDVPVGLTGVVAIAAGAYHSLALKGDGTVVAWGDNSLNQAGVPAGLDGVVALAGGDGFSMALKSDGTIVEWGDWGWAMPPDLQDPEKAPVIAIAARRYQRLALRSDVTVLLWGDLDGGQQYVPAELQDPATAHVVAIAAGDDHCLALRSAAYTVRPLYDQGKPHKLGSTVPIRLQILDAAGQNRSSAGIAVHAVALARTGDTGAPAPEATGNANPGADFRYDAGLQGYVYNLSTRGLSAGTWTLTFTIAGGADAGYAVTFTIR